MAVAAAAAAAAAVVEEVAADVVAVVEHGLLNVTQHPKLALELLESFAPASIPKRQQKNLNFL